MTDLSEFIKAGHNDVRKAKTSHPSGWEPGVDTEKGVVTARTDGDSPDWSGIIREFGLDPEDWTVEGGKAHVRTWDLPDGTRAFYYKADIAPVYETERVDLEELKAYIRGWRPRKTEPPTGERAFVVCVADTQFGKADGDGTQGTVNRFLAAIAGVEDRVRELRTSGRDLGTLYVFGLGDIIENCDGHYDMQTFSVELNRRDQIKLARRLLLKAVTSWSKHFDRVVVACVGGNHGENRKGGKAYTDFGDNDDVAVFEQLADILAANEDVFGHVRFVIPDKSLTVTLDVAGTVVGLAHGHQARTRGWPSKKLWDWWKNQTMGNQPIGDADLLLTGHYHHLTVTQQGARTHIQAPALDGGSEWFTNVAGQDSPPGMLTLTVADGGWDDLKIIGDPRG